MGEGSRDQGIKGAKEQIGDQYSVISFSEVGNQKGRRILTPSLRNINVYKSSDAS